MENFPAQSESFSLLPPWLERSTFEQDIEVVLRNVLACCNLDDLGLRSIVNRWVDEMPASRAPDAWHTKSRRMLVWLSLIALEGARPTLVDAMRLEMGGGNASDADGPRDPRWLREWHLAWLGKVGRLLRCRPSPAIQLVWMQCLENEQASPYAALVNAVFQGVGSDQVGQVVLALPPVVDRKGANDRLAWLSALFISRPHDFEPNTALAMLYQCNMAPIEHRSTLLRRLQRECDLLLLPMIDMAVDQRIFSVADWWVVVEVMSFALHVGDSSCVERFVASCGRSQHPIFGEGAQLFRWAAAGQELARLVTRLQPLRRDERTADLCDQIWQLLFDARGVPQRLGVSRAFLLSWIENLQALFNLSLSDSTQRKLLATVQSVWMALPPDHDYF